MVILTNLQGEFRIIGLFPGFWLNWFVEQVLIEILREPYFSLDNIETFFNLEVFGSYGAKFIISLAGNLSTIFNFIFYFTTFFVVSFIPLQLRRLRNH